MNDIDKMTVLAKIANGAAIVQIGKAKVRIDSSIVHVRFCSTNISTSGKFKFNINPNTLSADYELWMCGGAAIYYLMPIAFIEAIYKNPDTYIDRTHPKIRVVSVDSNSHIVTYATGGVSRSLQDYLCTTLQAL